MVLIDVQGVIITMSVVMMAKSSRGLQMTTVASTSGRIGSVGHDSDISFFTCSISIRGIRVSNIIPSPLADDEDDDDDMINSEWTRFCPA